MTQQELVGFNQEVQVDIINKTQKHSIKRQDVGDFFQRLAVWVRELFTRLPSRWVSVSVTPMGARRSHLVNGKEYDFISLVDNNATEPSITNADWAILGYDAGASAGKVLKKSAYYKSDILQSPSAFERIIPEMIGCDPNVFAIHRGTGTTYGGSLAPPSDDNVQVDPSTGTLTFLYEFTGPETIWCVYYPASTTPPDPGQGDLFNSDGTFNFAGTLDFSATYNFN